MLKSQYPYSLQILPKSDILKDKNGNFIPGTSDWEEVCKCRDEHGRNYKIETPDGIGYVATFVVFAPKGTEPLSRGTTIRVMDGDTLRITGKVIISRKEQFNTRLWV